MFDFCWSLGWHGFLLLSYLLFFLILLESNMTLFHFCCETSENHIPGSYVNLLSLSLDLQAHWQPMKWAAFNGSFGLFILTQLMLLFSFATSLLLSPFLGPWSWSSLHFNTWKNCFRWLRPSSWPPSSLGSVDAFIQSPPSGVVQLEYLSPSDSGLLDGLLHEAKAEACRCFSCRDGLSTRHPCSVRGPCTVSSHNLSSCKMRVALILWFRWCFSSLRILWSFSMICPAP